MILKKAEGGKTMPRAYLVLADGTVYEGEGFGADCEAVGELVFTTGMERLSGNAHRSELCRTDRACRPSH